MKRKKTRYSIFRYQLLPNESRQIDLFQKNLTKEQIVEQKNDSFKEVIINEKSNYRGKGTKIIGKIEYSNGEDILLKIGVEKSKEINKSDFKKETIKDYPNIDIYINNRKDKQLLFIENNLDAFSDTTTVVNILKNAWSQKLQPYKLSLYIQQTFNENEFWDTINQYKDRGITALKFEFIKPNISNISGEIKQVFSAMENNFNGHTIDLNIIAPVDGNLENIEQGGAIIETLLNYNKEGGGKPPYIKVKGIRSNIKTVNSEKTIEIAEFTGTDQELINILNQGINA